MNASQRFTISNGRAELAAARWGSGPARVVMLHDGLGSVAQWGEVPALVHQATGQAVMAYERAGHGASRPIPNGPWSADWLHREAEVFDRVVKDHTAGEDCLVVGHSDGASIALLQAAEGEAATGALLSLAAHSWVEEVCREAIVGMRARRDRLVEGLARSHDHPGELFDAWSGVWVSEQFRSWDIRGRLGVITVPTVIAQGLDDAYASVGHVAATAEAIGANADERLLEGLGHLLHYDDAGRVVDLIVETFAAVFST